jgi:hypothetical protein
MKTVWFDERPPYPVRIFTYRNEQARADDVQRVIVYILNRFPHRRRLRVASGATAPGPAQEQACASGLRFVKLYSSVNWKCWYMLRLKSFKVKFRSVVFGCLLYSVWLMYYFDLKNRCPQTGKNFMDNEKTKFMRQVAKVDLV